MTDEPGRLPAQVAAALERLDDLVRAFEDHPDEGVQDGLIEVLRAVDVIHRGALDRLVALLDARGLREVALSDPHVALLFGLYEAQEDDSESESESERSRAEAAVARIRPYVEEQGGQLEVVAAEGGVVNIRLLGAAGNGSGSTTTLPGLVEEALRTELPEFVRMDVSSPPQAPPSPAQLEPMLIPVSSVTVGRRARPPQSGCGSESHGCSSCR